MPREAGAMFVRLDEAHHAEGEKDGGKVFDVARMVIAGVHGLGLSLPERHAIAAIVADRAAPRTDQLVA
jgi:hypothetical protein